MKTGLSIVEIAQEIERQSKAKKDVIVDTRALSLDENMRLAIEGETLDILPLAHKQIAARLDIPAKYYDRMRADSPELLRENVNHWFGKTPEKRMIRMLDGKARAFLSNRYQRIDHNHIAEATLPILARIPGIEFKSAQITENKLYIKAVSTENRLLVPGSKRVGDFVESGVIISNSEVGLGSMSIMPFFHFLVCTNGMVRNKDGMKAYHVGGKQGIGADVWNVLSDNTRRMEDAAMLGRVRDVLSAAMDQVKFAEAVDAMAVTTKRAITGDVPAAVAKAAEVLKMSDTESSSVLRHLIEGGDLSQYGLMNAVTRTAEDLESYDRATEFEAMGGVILDMATNQWGVIAQAA